MSEPRIPILDLGPGIQSQWTELMTALESVVRSQQFIMGEQVREFEKETAAFLDVRHAIGVNSGTDALTIALRAVGVNPGDEVITSSFSFFATAEAVSIIGAVPVFVDIEPKTMNLDVKQIAGKVTAKTKAIIPVHIFGQPVEMDEISQLAKDYRLKVVEDVAQAFGAEYRGKRVGSFGNASAFSFFPSKNLGAFGDGGLITTNDDKVAELCRMLRNHGSKKRYFNEMMGYNSRLDEMQAAVLRVRLKKVDEWNRRRGEVAIRYYELFKGTAVNPPEVARERNHVFHQYTVRVPADKRDAAVKHLEANGISPMVYYPTPIHQLPVYKDRQISLPVTEKVATEVLSLPIWPELSIETQRRIASTLLAALA